MKIRNNFWFGLLLGVSVMLIPLSFLYADLERGYNATGGEVFMIALPILVMWWRRWSIKQIRAAKRLKSQRLKSQRMNQKPNIMTSHYQMNCKPQR